MNCLYCYKALSPAETDFHPACSRRIFGTPVPPALDYTESQMADLALQVIRSQVAVTGVQPKLSLDVERSAADPAGQRFTIVGLWGGFILKPPVPSYPALPELEDLTMHLAAIAGLPTVPHALIRMRSGNLAYITRRIDRIRPARRHRSLTMLAMEDMCQVTGKLSEDKYRGSYEQIAKALITYSAHPVLDVINFYEQVLFCFLTGNADAHLKNFSLIDRPGLGHILAPAYDMVATALVNPADTEELALTLNGRKRKLRRTDFEAAFGNAKLDGTVQRNIFRRFSKAIPKWMDFIDRGFIPEEMREQYKVLIGERAGKLEIG